MGFEIKDGVLVKYTGSDKVVNIPENVHTISKEAFIELNFLGGVLRTQYTRFQYLESVYIPDSVQTIEESAFAGCKSLKSVSMPERFKGINAFVGCSPDLKITYRPSVTEEKAEYSKDYKSFFLDYIHAHELSEKEAVFEDVTDDDIKIPFAVVLLRRYQSENAKEYIRQNHQKVMHYLIDKNELESISEILSIVK